MYCRVPSSEKELEKSVKARKRNILRMIEREITSKRKKEIKSGGKRKERGKSKSKKKIGCCKKGTSEKKRYVENDIERAG